MQECLICIAWTVILFEYQYSDGYTNQEHTALSSLQQLGVLLNKDPNKLINWIIHGRDDFLKYEILYELLEWQSDSSDPVSSNI